MKITELFFNERAPLALQTPFIIAGAIVNPGCGKEQAQRLVQEAADAGADAIRFQIFSQEALAFKTAPSGRNMAQMQGANSDGILQNHDSVWKKEFEQLKTFCDKTGITFLSTPYDAESAIFLNDLLDAFRISQSDITNMPLIKFICGFGKPVILPTGGAWLYEIAEAVEWIDQCGNALAILHGAPIYPIPDENAALGVVSALIRIFPTHVIGYSDHTQPGDMQNLITATLLGAKILEKRFTLDKANPGNDSRDAMDAHDLRRFYDRIRAILASIGPFTVRALPDGGADRKNARRSLAAARPIAAGQRISGADLTWKRPGHGISPGHIDEVIGKMARMDIAADAILQWTDLEN